jgi:hypothetical protein
LPWVYPDTARPEACGHFARDDDAQVIFNTLNGCAADLHVTGPTITEAERIRHYARIVRICTASNLWGANTGPVDPEGLQH